MKSIKLHSFSLLSLLICLSFFGRGFNSLDMRVDTIVGVGNRILARQIVEHMTLEEKISQMFIIDASEYNRKKPPGGVILFRNSLRDIEQIIKLTDEIQNNSKIPLFISIDQEGGEINRLSMGTKMPGNMALGAAKYTTYAYDTGKLIGKELKALGINVNFGPVLDINNNHNNPDTGIRSFGSNSELVGKLGVGYIKGLRRSRVISTGKHFPGLGDTDVNSHLALPRIPHSIDRLKEIELKPFQIAIDSGVDMIMTAHVSFPNVDDTIITSKKNGQSITMPATLSHKVLTGLLREEMGFEGVIITDAFNMKAISDYFYNEEAAVMAIQAGADIVLMPINYEKAYSTVLNAVKKGIISEERINESVIRIISLKSKYGILNAKKQSRISIEERVNKARLIINGNEHQIIEARIADSSVTMIKNEEMLPFKVNSGENILLIMPNSNTLSLTRNTILEISNKKNIKINLDHIVYGGNSNFTSIYQNKIDNANYIILGTYNLDNNRSRINYINSTIRYANNKQIDTVVMAMGSPYDIMHIENPMAYISIYGDFNANIKAGVKVILGENNPKGQLPVDIPSKDGSKVLYDFGFGLDFQ